MYSTYSGIDKYIDLKPCHYKREDGKMILKWISMMLMKMWKGFIWLRTNTGGSV